MPRRRLLFPRHAWLRMRQRDITPGEIYLIYRFASSASTDGAVRLSDSSIHTAKERGYALDHLRRVIVVVRDLTVVTVIKKEVAI